MTTETPASAAPAAPAQAAPSAPTSANELPNGAAPVGDGVPAADPAQPNSDPAQAPDSEEAARRAAARERFDKRFGEMSKRTREAELRAARLEGELAALRAGPQPTPQPAAEQPKANTPPNPADYPKGEWDPQYAADLAVHKIREDDRVRREREAEAERKRASESEFEAGRARYEDTLNRARALADGEGGGYFQNAERVLELGRVPLSQGGLSKSVIDAITESDNAVHVAEVLGRNPEHVPPELRGLIKSPRELAAMSPSQAQRVIARLDDRIGLILEATRQAKAKSAETPAPPTPQTPQPAPTPEAPNRGSTPVGEPPRGDFRAFKAWRAKVFGGA